MPHFIEIGETTFEKGLEIYFILFSILAPKIAKILGRNLTIGIYSAHWRFEMDRNIVILMLARQSAQLAVISVHLMNIW